MCEEDVFVMSGGSSKDLVLCGLNSGQHGKEMARESLSKIFVTLEMSQKLNFQVQVWF